MYQPVFQATPSQIQDGISFLNDTLNRFCHNTDIRLQHLEKKMEELEDSIRLMNKMKKSVSCIFLYTNSNNNDN